MTNKLQESIEFCWYINFASLTNSYLDDVKCSPVTCRFLFDKAFDNESFRFETL